MAVNISSERLLQYQFPNFLRLHVLIKLKRIRLLVRKFLLAMSNKKPRVSITTCAVTSNLEAQKEHFIKHGWAFIDDFFSDEFYAELLKNIPPFYYFNPMSHIQKSYDKGFIDSDLTYKKYPILTKVKDYFSSSSFTARINQFSEQCGSKRKAGVPFYTRAGYQSSVIPHLDSVADSKANKGHSLNLMIYIEGTGGPCGGGTCIMNDNEDDILFEPTNLNNSCLIYRSDQWNHGVLPMRFGAKRIAFGLVYQVGP